MKTAVETRKEELKNEMDGLFESFKKDADDLMISCPEWKVTRADGGAWSAIIYLALASNKHHTIEIRFQAKDAWQEEEFTTNVATIGSFDMLDAGGDGHYYIAVGSLLSKMETLSQLKTIMKGFVEKVRALREEFLMMNKK